MLEYKAYQDIIREFRTKYNVAHNFCPKCNENTWYSTLAGYPIFLKEDGTMDDGYKDENEVQCQCGWTGIRHDLVEKKI